MKKPALYLLFGFILLSGSFFAQAPSYQQLVSIISSKYPNLDLSDKIIAFHAWSTTDVASRAANKEFDRVCSIYQRAKLKNGAKGTVVISCNTDDKTVSDIAFQKDGISNLVTVNSADYAFLSNLSAGTNIVYDNTASKVYENLGTDAIFNSYNQLITR